MLATGAQATVPKHKRHCDIDVLQPAFSAVVCNHCLLSCGIQRSPVPLVRSFTFMIVRIVPSHLRLTMYVTFKGKAASLSFRNSLASSTLT